MASPFLARSAGPSHGGCGRLPVLAFIELAQNIVHYSADCLSDPAAVTDEVRYGTLKVIQTPIGFTLTCTNPVTRSAADRLEAKLSLLVKMSLLPPSWA